MAGGQVDPRLSTPEWRAIRTYWQGLRPERCEADVCLLPGQAITYGERRVATSLDVGHLGTRDQDERQTWTLNDTRPEHAHCNRSHGARYRHGKTTPPKRLNYTDPNW